jgi:hypothetical protein
MAKQFSVWWAFVTFADKPDEKKLRPVLVIDPRKKEVICLRMTSGKRKVASDFELSYWAEVGLPKKTVVNTSWRLRLPHDALMEYIGQLHDNDILILKLRYSIA